MGVVGSGVLSGQSAWIDVEVSRSGEDGPTSCRDGEYRAHEANATHWQECRKFTLCENSETISESPFTLNEGGDCQFACQGADTLHEVGASVHCGYCGTRGLCCSSADSTLQCVQGTPA